MSSILKTKAFKTSVNKLVQPKQQHSQGVTKKEVQEIVKAVVADAFSDMTHLIEAAIPVARGGDAQQLQYTSTDASFLPISSWPSTYHGLAILPTVGASLGFP
jgi:hypothetical protein